MQHGGSVGQGVGGNGMEGIETAMESGRGKGEGIHAKKPGQQGHGRRRRGKTEMQRETVNCLDAKTNKVKEANEYKNESPKKEKASNRNAYE